MPLRETKAFVLRTYALSDNDKICLLFTNDYGKARVVAKGARGVKSRFGSMLEPLTEVEVSFFERENRDLFTLSRCELVQSNFGWAASPEGAVTAHCMAELIDQFLPPGEANPTTYRLIKATTECLRDSADLVTSLAYFETWLLKLSGFLPPLDHCSRCGNAFKGTESIAILREGASLCGQCGGSNHGMALDPLARKTMLGSLRLSPRDWIATRPAAGAIKSFRTILYELIRHVLERDLKAQRFLSSDLSTR